MFVDRLIADGRDGGLEPTTLWRWKNNGMDVWVADRWACKLGYHPIEIWGQDFYVGCHGE